MARKPKTENEIVMSTGAAAPARRKTTAARPRRAATAPKPAIPEIASAIPATVQPELVTPSVEPSYEEIAALAYTYWEGRGCQGGCPHEDWLRAEQELRSRRASAVATA